MPENAGGHIDVRAGVTRAHQTTHLACDELARTVETTTADCVKLRTELVDLLDAVVRITRDLRTGGLADDVKRMAVRLREEEQGLTDNVVNPFLAGVKADISANKRTSDWVRKNCANSEDFLRQAEAAARARARMIEAFTVQVELDGQCSSGLDVLEDLVDGIPD